MVIRARAVVTMDGAPIENGAVRIAGAKIAAVGTWSDVRRDAPADEVVDLGERALLPGLINAHCHLDYTMMRGSIARPNSFTSWVGEINNRKAALTRDDYLASIAGGFAEAASFGTTTVANLEAFPELLGRMSLPPLRTWWFVELIDVREPVCPSAILDRMAAPRTSGGLACGAVGSRSPVTVTWVRRGCAPVWPPSCTVACRWTQTSGCCCSWCGTAA